MKGKSLISAVILQTKEVTKTETVIFLETQKVSKEKKAREIEKNVSYFFRCQRAPSQSLFIFFLTCYIERKNLILLENKILKTSISVNFINWGGDFGAMTGVLIKENRIPNQEFENRGNSQCWRKVWIWRFKELKELLSHGES